MIPITYDYRENNYPATRSPLKVIRRRCADCVTKEPGWQKRIRECPGKLFNDAQGEDDWTPCYCWPYRFGRRPQTVEKNLKRGLSPTGYKADNPKPVKVSDPGILAVGPLKAIRKDCVWCMNGNYFEVARCDDRDCPTWCMRHGKRAKWEDPYHYPSNEVSAIPRGKGSPLEGVI